MTTKIEYGKCDSAEMMVELKKRGYVVMSQEKYQQQLKSLNKSKKRA
jgi:hypothetical protein